MNLSPRPTQQARSAKTQQKLIDAAIETLVELGIANLTTTEVCRRAGTSQGALFKHFPSKSALVCSAMESLYASLVEDYRLAVQVMPEGIDRVEFCVDSLWALFQTPKLLAVYDLHIAARTDPMLRDVVAPMEKAHRAQIRELAARLFPEVKHRADFTKGIEIVVNSVQGAAVGSMALLEPEILAELLAGLKLVARQFLEASDD